MDYNLVCVHPFGNYEKGQVVSDKDEVAKLSVEREQNFVRVPAPKEEAKDQEVIPPKFESKSSKRG